MEKRFDRCAMERARVGTGHSRHGLYVSLSVLPEDVLDGSGILLAILLLERLT